ncbi:helix-turn-helix transcriptional regulator [Actinomycetes bacterium KLBMP 9797]
MARSIMDPRFPSTLRRWREKRGLSLRALAPKVYLSKSKLQNLETGRTVPTVEEAQRLDATLQAGGEIVGLASMDHGVRRRAFLAGAGLAAALSHAPPRQSRQVGAEVPVKLVQRTARLRRLDDYLGGADTWRTYAAEVAETEARVKEGVYTEATGLALLAVLAEQAQLAGWAAFDAGLWSQSDELYQMSLDAANDAGDQALAANALIFKAYQSLTAGDVSAGVEAATAAVDTAGDSVTPGVRALLHLRRAWAHAIAGQAWDAETHLGLGATAITGYDDRAEPDWVYWVDQTEVDIMTGRCWAVLHRPLRAILTLEQVLARYDDTHARDKGLYMSWLADAYLDANEVEQGCDVARRAIQLVAGVGSIRPYDRIGKVVNRTEQYGDLPCAVDVRTEFREWSRQRQLTSAATPGRQPIQPRST